MIMPGEFDYYHQLLSIPPAEQPPNHYRLLGLAVFETDPSVISHAAARQMRFVREIAVSKFGEVSQQLLNELTAAKLCLLDPAKKDKYDRQLRETLRQREQQPTAIERVVVDSATRTNLPPPQPTVHRREWLVGSSTECDIILDSDKVSRRHCKIVQTPEGLFVQDLDSLNGTMVNRKPLKGQRELLPGDVVTLGQHTLLPIPQGVRFSLPRDSVILIGRNEDNDVILHHATVSGRHARILRQSDDLVLEDLGSTNGTSVGNVGNRIIKSPISREQTVFFGEYRVRVDQLLDRRSPST